MRQHADRRYSAIQGEPRSSAANFALPFPAGSTAAFQPTTTLCYSVDSAPFKEVLHVPPSLPSRLREILGRGCVSRKISVSWGLVIDPAPAQTLARCALAQPRFSSSAGQCSHLGLQIAVGLRRRPQGSFESTASDGPDSFPWGPVAVRSVPRRSEPAIDFLIGAFLLGRKLLYFRVNLLLALLQFRDQLHSG